MGTDSRENISITAILKRFSKSVAKYPQIKQCIDYPKINSVTIKEIVDVLEYMLTFFKEIETYINVHQNEVSITLDFENIVRDFAREIFDIVFPFYDELYKNQKYINLLKQRHMAYVLYKHINFIGIERYEKSQGLLVQAYVGLADFYKYFYGNFKDNEEAIELLCKYYPEKMSEALTHEELAKILYPHISNAGTPNDLGYSYRGISIIKKYIERLSPKVIYYLLNHYRVSDIVYKDICRHQIVTIINYSCLTKEEKRELKFQYVDFFVLAGYTYFMVDKISNENYGILYLGYCDRFLDNKLLFSVDTSIYWQKESKEIYRLFVKEVPYLEIELLEEHAHEIWIKNIRNGKEIKLQFLEDSWMVDYLFEKDMPELLRRLWENDEIITRYKQMFFSMLYLNNYRGIKNQQIHFEHEFSYNYESRKVKKGELEEEYIPHFYGKKIHSLSCIVGKNGTGKTSIVDFLRETFFRLVKLIQMNIIKCEKGYVAEESYQKFNIFDKGAEFLIVFKLDSVPYFLTNIKDINVEEIEPFSREVYFDDNEFSKVVYFSNMLKSNQKYLYVDDEKSKKENKGNEEQALAESLEEFRQIDYSENDSFIRRRRSLAVEAVEQGNTVNRDLCYQFTFLKNISKEKLQEYLDLDDKKEFHINSDRANEKSFSLNDLTLKRNRLNKIESLEKDFIYLSDAWISHFSSGQYVKFAFLSKLYWFLEGYRKEKQYYDSLIGTNEFSVREVLEENDTALIFIDEGELFYHPEWQRKYLSILLGMINSKAANAKLQIVITTNSPFILSDVLKEDVIYLNKEENVGRRYDSPLGQNIHKLLKDNFFMDYTIGEYGRKLIDNLIEGLEIRENKNKDLLKDNLLQYFDEEMDELEAVRRIISKIGEPIYRQCLEELADKFFRENQEKEIQYMEEKIKMLQREVEQKKAVLKEGNR